MQDTFTAIKDAIKEHCPEDSQTELAESARNLIGFFELLLEIDQENKERRNEDQRSKHSIHQTK